MIEKTFTKDVDFLNEINKENYTCKVVATISDEVDGSIIIATYSDYKIIEELKNKSFEDFRNKIVEDMVSQTSYEKSDVVQLELSINLIDNEVE